MQSVEAYIIKSEETLILVQLITRKEQITVFMVCESMFHVIAMEQASEILSKKEHINKHLTHNMCFSPHWKANVAELFGYSFKFSTRKEQVSTPTI